MIGLSCDWKLWEAPWPVMSCHVMSQYGIVDLCQGWLQTHFPFATVVTSEKQSRRPSIAWASSGFQRSTAIFIGVNPIIGVNGHLYCMFGNRGTPQDYSSPNKNRHCRHSYMYMYCICMYIYIIGQKNIQTCASAICHMIATYAKCQRCKVRKMSKV